MRFVLPAAAAAAVLFASGAALACSCVPQSSAAEQLRGTDLAFKGRPLGTRVAPDGRAVTRFRVAEVLKGRAPRTVAVEHHTSSATCGLTFARGRTALVFAEQRGRAWRTGLCSAPQFPEADYRRRATAPGPPTP